MTRTLVGCGMACVVLAGSFQSALAKDDVYTSGPFHVDMGVEIGAGAVAQINTNFGAGRVDLKSFENTGDADWAEGYVRPTLGLRYDVTPAFTLFGFVSGITASTLGEGDAAGFTNAGTDLDLDQAFGGVKLKLMGGKGSGGWDLSLSGGQQNMILGESFLFDVGDFNIYEDQTYWLAPKKAFSDTAIATLENDTTKITAFRVVADIDSGGADVVGTDIQYTDTWGGVGFIGAKILDDNGLLQRAGMDLVSFRAQDVKVPLIDNLTFSGDFVYQFGNDHEIKYDAYGYFAEISYKFASLPWQPTISYRNSGFSGDSDPFDNNITAYDPLFYGFTTWSRWFQGEVVGQSMLFSSNELINMFKVAVSPTETTGVGVMYFDFDLKEPNYYGAPVSSKDFAREIDAYVEWFGVTNWYVSGLVGVALPDTAAKELFGSDTTYTFEMVSIYKY